MWFLDVIVALTFLVLAIQLYMFSHKIKTYRKETGAMTPETAKWFELFVNFSALISLYTAGFTLYNAVNIKFDFVANLLLMGRLFLNTCCIWIVYNAHIQSTVNIYNKEE